MALKSYVHLMGGGAEVDETGKLFFKYVAYVVDEQSNVQAMSDDLTYHFGTIYLFAGLALSTIQGTIRAQVRAWAEMPLLTVEFLMDDKGLI